MTHTPSRGRLLPFLCLLGAAGWLAFRGATLAAVAEEKKAAPFPDHVRQFFAAHCLACHGPERTKGQIRLDILSDDFSVRANRDHWSAVIDQVKEGAMPPGTKPRPPEKEVKAFLAWAEQKAEAAATVKRAEEGRVVYRRLNRVEYQNTLRDLLGIEVDLIDMLPADTPAHGFDNVGEALHVSSFLMEKYLEAADIALNKAIVNLPKPPTVKKRLHLKDERHVKHTTEKVFRVSDDELVFFTSSPWQGVTVGQFYPPDRGTYHFRISASAVQSNGKPVTFRIDAGPMLMATKNHLVGYFDAPPEKPAVVEFTDFLEARNTIRLLPYGMTSAQAVNKVGADKWDGPGLAVQWVEVEGPMNEVWPPHSHRRLFGDMDQGPSPVYNYRNRVEVVSKDPLADAERILKLFVRRAFRRAVNAEDLKPFLNLVKSTLDAKNTFEQAVRVALTAVLVSPQFLFLQEKPGKLDDFALAARLSYFLWGSMPDDELLSLAEQKKLSRPEVLRRQTERLLQHAKASVFVENFVGQWLNLRDIDFTEPSHILYPEYDHMLKVSMVKETELFFAEVLKDDHSLMNFVASDFSMLNGRLAKHYGIPGVEGYAFRKVKLPENSHRGGVMTMASVLKVTANGTATSPVTRGAFVLDRILGTPPPKPPGDIPGLEPDIRGAKTMRELLAKHRELPACASCHVKIDPPGFALESFDVIGGYREHYRTHGRGKPVTIDGRKMPYLEGLKVDPADVLDDGRKFKDIDELKSLYLQDKDQLARAMTEKMLTYATGGVPERIDRPEVEAIIKKSSEKNYGLRTLVHALIQSKAFQHK